MKRNLLLHTELRHGYHDVRLMEYERPTLTVYDRSERVAIKIVDLPHWVRAPRDERTITSFIKGFSSEYKEALLYLLEDSQPIPKGQEVPVCTFKHLTQLADFLKETI